MGPALGSRPARGPERGLTTPRGVYAVNPDGTRWAGYLLAQGLARQLPTQGRVEGPVHSPRPHWRDCGSVCAARGLSAEVSGRRLGPVGAGVECAASVPPASASPGESSRIVTYAAALQNAPIPSQSSEPESGACTGRRTLTALVRNSSLFTPALICLGEDDLERCGAPHHGKVLLCSLTVASVCSFQTVHSSC